MKKFTLVTALMVLLCGTALSAKDFDWSECWCNYGGGIKQGDFLVNVDAGLMYTDLAYIGYNDFWFLPPVLVEVQYAQPIWKLPFTFGGYAGFHGFNYGNDYSYWGVFFGGEIEYHVMLPPEELDVYAATRIGGSIPFVKNGTFSLADYYHAGGAIGANWFFNKGFGVNLEFGYPFTKFGVTFKF